MSLSMMASSLVPVRPREMAATARTLGSSSNRSCKSASMTAGFWKVARGGGGGGGGIDPEKQISNHALFSMV